ncbi:MAG: O-antigen ligase family protein [Ignavibacteria bacterium]|nr:O-antigen ligase family protein [Ignavibacteria bacterium]
MFFLSILIFLCCFIISEKLLRLIILYIGLCLSVYKLSYLYIHIDYSFTLISGSRVFYADIIAGIILFTLGTFFAKDIPKRYYFILLIFSITCSLVYLFLLRTRTGYIAVATGLLVLSVVLIFQYKKGKITDSNSLKRKLWIVSGIFILAIIISAVLPSKIEERSSLYKTVTSIFDKDYHSNKLRLMYWDTSLKMFADNPVTGIGSGQWTGMASKYMGDVLNDENKNMNLFYTAHNDYLEMLAEYGIWGLLYAIFIFTGIYFLFRITMKDINYLPYLITAVGFSVTSFFNFTHENIWAMSLFMICLGMGYGKHLIIRFKRFENLIAFINKKQKVKYSFYAALMFLISGFIILKIYHYSIEKRYVAAINLKMRGNYKEMIAELDKIPEWIYTVDMNKMPVSFYRGAGNFELGNYDEALKDFRKAREYSKYYPTIMMNEALALYATGKYEEAISTLKQLKTIAPNFIEPQINLLSMYANLKMNDESKTLIYELDNKMYDPVYVKNYSVFIQIKNYFK